MLVWPDKETIKMTLIGIVGALLLSFIISCPANANRKGLKDIQVTGTERVILITKDPKILEAIQWLTVNVPEAFVGVPETSVWKVTVEPLETNPPEMAERTYALTFLKGNRIKFNIVHHYVHSKENIRAILLHELIHARLFAQGVYGSICAMAYHEMVAYAADLEYKELTGTGPGMQRSASYGYEAYNYEYRARYCDTWFAPAPEYPSNN